MNTYPPYKKNYAIHLIYAISSLLALAMILCYLVWDKHQIYIQKKNEIEQRVSLEKKHRLEILTCIRKAEKKYAENISAACKVQYQQRKVAFTNCIGEAISRVNYLKKLYASQSEMQRLYNLKISQCKSSFGISTCLLSDAVTDNLNKIREREVVLCRY